MNELINILIPTPFPPTPTSVLRNTSPHYLLPFPSEKEKPPLGAALSWGI